MAETIEKLEEVASAISAIGGWVSYFNGSEDDGVDKILSHANRWQQLADFLRELKTIRISQEPLVLEANTRLGQMLRNLPDGFSICRDSLTEPDEWGISCFKHMQMEQDTDDHKMAARFEELKWDWVFKIFASSPDAVLSRFFDELKSRGLEHEAGLT